MGRKLTIPYYRPTFVQKDLSEVGDGTEWPMPVTVDQLAEVMYRVRDCKFTAGELVILFTPEVGDPFTSTMSFNFSDPPEALASRQGDSLLARAYCTIADGDLDAPDPDPDPMVSWNSTYFGASYQVGDTGFNSGIVREAIDELAIHTFVDDPPTPTSFGKYDFFAAYNGFSGLNDPPNMTFRTGLDYLGFGSSVSSYGGADESGFPTCVPTDVFAEGSDAYVDISNEVAFIDNAGNGNPFDPANDLYLGITFAQTGDPFFLTTRQDDFNPIFPSWGTPTATGSNFEIELSSGVIQCPLYWYCDPVFFPSLSSATNYRLKATKWWPYADENGDPVWDTATGAKL